MKRSECERNEDMYKSFDMGNGYWALILSYVIVKINFTLKEILLFPAILTKKHLIYSMLCDCHASRPLNTYLSFHEQEQLDHYFTTNFVTTIWKGRIEMNTVPVPAFNLEENRTVLKKGQGKQTDHLMKNTLIYKHTIAGRFM